MKYLIALFIIAAISAFIRPHTKDNKRPATSANSNGFAVVELFTSEGCSSCPPADRLAEKIQQENLNRSVYVLAFHVDYWNHLGWKDRFSDAAYTARQQQYARWLHVESIYTPQMVINGSHEYVGSNEGSITKAITRELGQPSSNTLTIKAGIDGDKLHVTYQTADEKNAGLVLALVQRSAESDVRAGENAGKKLSHVQIVRQLLYHDVGDKKAITIDRPNNFSTAGWELIGFIQNKKDGHITAAARYSFQ